jgi:Histidine kinase-, DNA gyrase B-, and HSP90-like ATPase
VLGKNADGYLEVFKVEADGALLHRWQKRASGDWSSWASLGGAVLPGIAVVTNADGRMEVFGVERASQTLGHVRQAGPNSVEWSGWKELGGAIQPPVTVGQNAAGLLEVFALEAGGNRVKHLRQTSAPDGWSEWEDLGGAMESQLTVARNQDGRLELFGIEAGSRQLVHRWQTRPGGNPDWSEWAGLGGAIEPGFAVGRNVLGLLEVFAVARTNNGMVRICQSAPGESLKWTVWEDFSGQSPIGPLERAAPSRPDAPQAEALPTIVLPAEVRHDLFLVVKEAFNNILKHSQASEVRVRISANDTAVTIEIEDNGCGFDPAKNGGGRVGNGLTNMRKRIEGLGGELCLASTPSQGTKLKVRVKVKPLLGSV